MKTRKRHKYKVTKHLGFNIRHVGTDSFMADICSHGQRDRRCFRTLSEAKTYCELKRVEAKNKGAAAFDFTDRDRVELLEAKKLLGEVSILQAARFYQKHHRRKDDGISVSRLIDEYLAAPGKRGKNKAVKRRPDTLKGAAWRLNAFARAYGDRPAQEVTEDDVERWLDENQWQGLNRRHYLANVHALYEFARRKKFLELNPAADIEKPDVEVSIPRIMPPSEVMKLLMAAESSDGILIGCLALQFFAGLRPKEAREIDWRDIDLVEGLIRVVPSVAKMKRQRLLEIPDNLGEWLGTYRRESGPVWPKCSNGLYKALRTVKKAAGVELPDNAGRHAFASYHMVENDPVDTAKALGHTNTELLVTTYRGLVTRKAASAYWNIRPRAQGKILAFAN